MIEKPIIMDARSARAITAGKKTQVRKVINPQPIIEWDCCDEGEWETVTWKDFEGTLEDFKCELPHICTYGMVGDRLWVKEPYVVTNGGEAIYRAKEGEYSYIGWRNAKRMAKKHSRILLEITDIKIGRVKSISEEDAVAEGMYGSYMGPGYKHGNKAVGVLDQYEHYWNTLNAKRGHSWYKNPWVWIIEFKVIKL